MKRCGLRLVVFTLLAVGLLAGCSSQPEKPKTFPVTGTVTQGGKPVEGATVVFVPAEQGVEAAVAMTDAEGKYQLTTFTSGDGARAGEYRVKISKYNMPKSTGEGKNLSHEEEQKVYVEETTPTEPAKNLLPPKYENETTSGITHTVKDGPTTLDIKIE